MSNPSVTTPPSVEPLDKPTVKRHLRLEADYLEEDDDLDRLIGAARRWAELQLQRRLITTAQQLTRDRFPRAREIELPYGPVVSVELVEYTPDGGTPQVFDDTNYLLDDSKRRARIVLERGRSWPSDTLRAAAAVTVDYTSGFGAAAADVPADIRAALLLKIESLYNNRGEEVIGIGAVALRLENSAMSLLGIHAEGSPL